VHMPMIASVMVVAAVLCAHAYDCQLYSGCGCIIVHMPMIASFMVVAAEQRSCGPDYTGAKGRDIVLGWS
jgi:hypothetical protein